MPRIETRALTSKDWPVIERLFGKNGACGGCWCMYWRVEKGERWEDLKGAAAKKRFKKLVESGAAHGVLAFVDGEPVGWASADRRTDYAKLDRAPSLACDDAAQVGSVPCFFIHKDFRGKGVATALLSAALPLLRRLGARVAEGYPTQPSGAGKIPAAFAWTGVPALFAAQGFTRAGEKTRGKVRMRKKL